MRRMPGGIVTGASRGLGLALARALDERGWDLVVDARGAGPLAGAAGDLQRGAANPATDAAVALQRVTAIPGDIADAAHRRALVEAAGERIDLVVNNASLL